MISFDYDKLSASVLGQVEPAVAHSIRHNLAILRAIHWGARGVLNSDVDFDPRTKWWDPPERRFLVAFLSDTWMDWPSDETKHPAIEQFSVALSTALDRLRERGKISFLGVDYDRKGGLAKVLAPVRTLAESFDDNGWASCRPKKHGKRSAAQALLAFLKRVEVDNDFSEHERSLQQVMRWWAVLGARSPEQLIERQRFFWLYRLLLCTSNAYVRAGAQYFGPVIGNTKISLFRDVLRRWREGVTPSEAPLMALDKGSDKPADRSHTNIARELWGFLNLARVPFYNAQADIYLDYAEDPIEATLRIGESTRDWLQANPRKETELSAAFELWLARAQRAEQQPLAKVRRFLRKKELDEQGNAVETGAPLDLKLNKELTEQGTKHLLDTFSRRERAAMMLHLALDAAVMSDEVEENDEDVGEIESGRAKAATDLVLEKPGSAAEDSPTVDVTARFAVAKNVWIYSPFEQATGFPADLDMKVARLYWHGIDLHTFASREDIQARTTSKSGDSLTLWTFSRDVAVGDILVARRGLKTIIGLGRVTRLYFYAAEADEHDGPHRLGVEWFWTGAMQLASESSQFAQRAFVNGTHRRDELVNQFQGVPRVVAKTDPPSAPAEPEPPYTMEHALKALFFTQAELEKWTRLLERRRNLVLTGPPGVGKTFVAERLAWLLIGAKREDAITFVQFHQAYSYEQFVLGYRPAGGDRPTGGAPNESKSRPQFELSEGPLFRIAEQAHAAHNKKFVLIIDEINRGNISRILGEALMLLEADKRHPRWGVELAYRPERSQFADGKFHLPPNLYVIGTMNTADRSLAVVDYALRRRFAFVDIKPRVDSDEFAQHMRSKKLPESVLARLRECVKQLNQRIAEDRALGPGFAIGHSFFTIGDDEPDKEPWQTEVGPAEAEVLAHAWLDDVFEYELEPLLREYWAEDAVQCQQAIGLLHKKWPQA
jgi:MoxR-like ATPase